MTSIARKILNQNEHDNMTLDRLKNGSGYQEHEPVSVTHDSKKDKISYIFSDGSKLINHDNDWCCE